MHRQFPLVSLVPVLALALGGCASTKGSTTGAIPDDGPANVLTADEQAAGWRLLFDGKTTTGWRGHKMETFPQVRWVVEGGTIHRTPNQQKKEQEWDIITVDQFDNFDLRWQWKLGTRGNTGLKYLIDEAMATKKQDEGIGFEYQMLDDNTHPDAAKGIDGNRRTGSLYDLIPAAKDKVVNPVGQWNESRVLVDGNHIEHWLNGSKILSFERGSPEFKALIAGSKFKEIAGFGDVSRGPILLQDHGDEAWFRNIKLRPLPVRQASTTGR
jgi:hypothetical protein